MKNFKITIYPERKIIEAPKDKLVLDILTENGYFINTPCGGKGICGKCTIKAEGKLSDPIGIESSLKDKNMRLACTTTIQGDVNLFVKNSNFSINLPKFSVKKDSKISVAVDIGTTTIQIAFVDLTEGLSHKSSTILNPQRRYGHDVISRISESSKPGIAKKLTSLLRNQIIKLILQTLQRNNIKKDSLQEIAISGNSVMLYSFIGIDLEPLGKYPYPVSTKNFSTYSNIFKETFAGASFFALPILSAFLGGDLLGGLAYSIFNKMDKSVFFIDIGTNGEMFLIDNFGKIFATSCAMGPALEGMDISYGMTAGIGAINHFSLNKDGTIETFIIGEKKIAIGLTGTAIIDLIAILLKLGIINKEGKMLDTDENIPDKFIYDYDDKKIYLDPDNSDICLTQKDIRNIQLAKGASYGASLILANQANIDRAKIKTVLIAGSFGEHLNIENFKKLKFILDFSNAEYKFLGNTSLAAAELAILEPEFKKLLTSLQKKVNILELSENTKFNDIFVDSLNF